MRLKKRGGIYHYDFTYHGERVRGSTGHTDKYLAGLKAHDDFEKVRNQGTSDVLRKAPTLETFAVEFLKWVEENQRLSELTKDYYPRGWRLLKDSPLAGMAMDQIGNHHCETIRFPGGNANANCALRTLRRMLTKAKETKQLYGDLPVIKLRPEEPRSVQMSEADALLIDAHWKPGEHAQDARDAFRIIRSSGMRPCECYTMRWEYMDWERAQYHIHRGKTPSSRRHVPLNFPPFDSMAILKDRHSKMGCPSEGWIFPSRSDLPGLRSKCGHLVSIKHSFQAARDRAGLPKQMVLYTARHGAATNIAEVTTLKNSMQLLGHCDVKIAMRYQHPDSKEIAARLWDRAKTNGSVQ